MNITHAPRLLAGFGTLMLLASVGLFASSRPAHTAGGPISVNVANTPLPTTTADAQNSVTNGVETVPTAGSTGLSSGTLYTVPANERLVIDQVSAASFVTNDPKDGFTIIIDATRNGVSAPAYLNIGPNSTSYPAGTQPMRLYADPGTTVMVYADTTANVKPEVFVSFSGHLEHL